MLKFENLKRLLQKQPKQKPDYDKILETVKANYRVKLCNGGWVVERYSIAILDYEWMPTDRDGNPSFIPKETNFFLSEETANSFMQGFIEK